MKDSKQIKNSNKTVIISTNRFIKFCNKYFNGLTKKESRRGKLYLNKTTRQKKILQNNLNILSFKSLTFYTPYTHQKFGLNKYERNYFLNNAPTIHNKYTSKQILINKHINSLNNQRGLLEICVNFLKKNKKISPLLTHYKNVKNITLLADYSPCNKTNLSISMDLAISYYFIYMLSLFSKATRLKFIFTPNSNLLKKFTGAHITFYNTLLVNLISNLSNIQIFKYKNHSEINYEETLDIFNKNFATNKYIPINTLKVLKTFEKYHLKKNKFLQRKHVTKLFNLCYYLTLSDEGDPVYKDFGRLYANLIKKMKISKKSQITKINNKLYNINLYAQETRGNAFNFNNIKEVGVNIKKTGHNSSSQYFSYLNWCVETFNNLEKITLNQSLLTIKPMHFDKIMKFNDKLKTNSSLNSHPLKINVIFDFDEQSKLLRKVRHFFSNRSINLTEKERWKYFLKKYLYKLPIHLNDLQVDEGYLSKSLKFDNETSIKKKTKKTAAKNNCTILQLINKFNLIHNPMHNADWLKENNVNMNKLLTISIAMSKVGEITLIVDILEYLFSSREQIIYLLANMQTKNKKENFLILMKYSKLLRGEQVCLDANGKHNFKADTFSSASAAACNDLSVDEKLNQLFYSFVKSKIKNFQTNYDKLISTRKSKLKNNTKYI